MGTFVDLVDKIRSYGPLEKQAIQRTKNTHLLEEGLLAGHAEGPSSS